VSGAAPSAISITAGLGLALAGSLLVVPTGQGTRGAAIAGFVTAGAMVVGFGVSIMAPLALFVVGGGVLTGIGRTQKDAANAAEPNWGRRDARNVLAKLGLPALLGLCAAAFSLGDGDHALEVAATAALAGAFADTAATEAGPLAKGPVVRFARGAVLPAAHGDPGGVSVAGVAAAALAAIALSALAFSVGLLSSRTAVAAVAGGGAGAALLESLLAGTLWGRRCGHFGRNLFVSSASAALAAGALAASTMARSVAP
jgi:uncharacterized membrane protein